MPQERVIGQVEVRLQHCLEQRDRLGTLTLTTWLVHRHGYSLLQQLLDQPRWLSHRLWWEEQIHHPNLDLQPPSEPRPQPHCKTVPTATQDKTPMAAKSTASLVEPIPVLQQHMEPQEELRFDEHPADRTESPDQSHDDGRITPAWLSKQRLKMGKPARPVEDEEMPAVTQAALKNRPAKGVPDRQQRSLHLRGWLPHSQLPHQYPRQDAA